MPIKLKIEFDGWINLSRKQQKDILTIARNNFMNANFVIDRTGLLIEDNNELNIHKFCLDIIEVFKDTFKALDGYVIKRMSQKHYINISNIKRILTIEYFTTLIQNNNIDDASIVLAGMLYLTPDDIKPILAENGEINDIYKVLITYAGTKNRPFSI